MKTVFSKAQNPQTTEQKIALALCGGGSTGAFTSGVLHALLEDGIVTQDNLHSVSGTSAGALNAAALSSAAGAGDVKKAAGYLATIWRDVISRGKKAGMYMVPEGSGGYPNLDTYALEHGKLAMKTMQALGLASQPGTVEAIVTSALGKNLNLIHNGQVKTFVGAVRVSSDSRGREVLSHKTFSNHEITPSVIAASGTLIGKTRIANDYFVDGAYLKNPALDVLDDGVTTDMIAIVLYPEPRKPIRAVHEDDNKPVHGRFIGPAIYENLSWLSQNSKLHLHVIAMPHEPHWDETMKMNVSERWINERYNAGYLAGKEWAAKNKHLIGKVSTFNPTPSSHHVNALEVV